MLLKLFKRALPSVFAGVILLTIFGWLKSLLGAESYPFYFDESHMPLYAIVLYLVGESILAQQMVALLTMLLCAFLLIQLNTKHILIKYRTYLPPLFFIIISSSFLPLQRINPAVFAAIFLILALDNILSSYDSKRPIDRYFKASFLVGIASLFYFAAIFYVLLVFISIIILRPSGVREWFVSLLGFIAPWFFLFFYHYFFHDNVSAIPNLITSAGATIDIKRFYGILFTIFYSYSGLLVIITLLYLLNSLSTQKISHRKYHSIFIWFFLISVAVAFLSPFSSIEITYLGAIPTAFIFSHFFTFSRNRFWTEALFTLLIVIAVLMQFYN